jgi:hypothetical protein
VGDVAYVSEVRATSTFRVEVYKLVSCCFEKGDIHTYKTIHQLTDFNPEKGGSIYLRNAGNTAHNQTV